MCNNKIQLLQSHGAMFNDSQKQPWSNGAKCPKMIVFQKIQIMMMALLDSLKRRRNHFQRQTFDSSNSFVPVKINVFLMTNELHSNVTCSRYFFVIRLIQTN